MFEVILSSSELVAEEDSKLLALLELFSLNIKIIYFLLINETFYYYMLLSMHWKQLKQNSSIILKLSKVSSIKIIL